MAAPLLEGELEIMPEQGPLEPRDSESMARVVCPFGVCVHFASKVARREHQTAFEELEGLIHAFMNRSCRQHM